jgi:glycosyltransferase involved in cell wall biosynthesis
VDCVKGSRGNAALKVQIVSASDNVGGAARAAYRLHRSLLGQGAMSGMAVRNKNSDDWTVTGPESGFAKASRLLRPVLGNFIGRLQRSGDLNFRSGNWLPSAWSGELNAADAEVVNLHWVGDETLSIEDIGRIRKPVVWTLHDMWPFCGMEHYTAHDEHARWRLGYSRENRPASDGGVDLDRLAWQRKCRAWERPMHIVAPSQWLADCARQSALFKEWPISVIPNVLDTGTFQPLGAHFCRQALGLPEDRQIILFGAMCGGRDPRKGYDLLLDALAQLASRMDPQNVLCVVFGQSSPRNPYKVPFNTRWMGHVHDDATLALLYNAADVMVVSSRQENLPQTATEPQACGCPVVAFDCTGLRDAVVHRETGYLARAFDTGDMAEGLHWILEDAGRRDALSHTARTRAKQLWSPEVVVPQYLSVYRTTIERN